jgi:hypothetical protein
MQLGRTRLAKNVLWERLVPAIGQSVIYVQVVDSRIQLVKLNVDYIRVECFPTMGAVSAPHVRPESISLSEKMFASSVIWANMQALKRNLSARIALMGKLQMRRVCPGVMYAAVGNIRHQAKASVWNVIQGFLLRPQRKLRVLLAKKVKSSHYRECRTAIVAPLVGISLATETYV